MNKQNIEKIVSVINALNGIEVKGKTNLMNLSGSIAVLEEVYRDMANEHQSEKIENTKGMK